MRFVQDDNSKVKANAAPLRLRSGQGFGASSLPSGSQRMTAVDLGFVLSHPFCKERRKDGARIFLLIDARKTEAGPSLR
jgi:hypothetical protein